MRLSKAELRALLEVSPIKVYAPGSKEILYGALPHQVFAHQTNAKNFLSWGTRGTGKSRWLRWDAIIRCMMIPNFQALIIRRTMPQLRQSHLNDIPTEMAKLGGEANGFKYLHTLNVAKFPNGSKLTFAHCETKQDVENFLSAQYGFIGFDEISTFDLELFLKISAASRAPEGENYTAVVRCSSNPLGLGAQWMKEWFIDHDVNYEEYPDYNPDDFQSQFSTLDDNPFLNREDYEKTLKNLPEHVRRAWLNGEFVIEGAYFADFRARKDDKPWHVIDEIPTIATLDDHGQMAELPINLVPWVSIYRAIDWGYDPDPAVCLWIAVLPNKRAIVFKEMKWKRTIAKDVAADIKKASKGMKIVETFADPSMFIKTGVVNYSTAEMFENNGIPLTASLNDRTQYGYSIHDYLNTLIDGSPQLQLVKSFGDGASLGAHNLIRTLPMMRMGYPDTNKMADGEDHWVVALAYFCMGLAMPAATPVQSIQGRWQQPKWKHALLKRAKIGA